MASLGVHKDFLIPGDNQILGPVFSITIHSNRPNLNSFKLRSKFCTEKVGNCGWQLDLHSGKEFSITIHNNRPELNTGVSTQLTCIHRKSAGLPGFESRKSAKCRYLSFKPGHCAVVHQVTSGYFMS